MHERGSGGCAGGARASLPPAGCACRLPRQREARGKEEGRCGEYALPVDTGPVIQSEGLFGIEMKP